MVFIALQTTLTKHGPMMLPRVSDRQKMIGQWTFWRFFVQPGNPRCRVSTPWEKDDGYLGALRLLNDGGLKLPGVARSFFTVGCCWSIWLTMHKPSHPSVWSHLTSTVTWYLKEGIQIIEFQWIWQHWKCHRYTFRKSESCLGEGEKIWKGVARHNEGGCFKRTVNPIASNRAKLFKDSQVFWDSADEDRCCVFRWRINSLNVRRVAIALNPPIETCLFCRARSHGAWKDGT